MGSRGLKLSMVNAIRSPVDPPEMGKAKLVIANYWESLYSAVSRPFPRSTTGRIAVKVINHLGDGVMKVYSVA